MIRVGENGAHVIGLLWRIAALTATGVFGATSQAEAARYYQWDSDPGYYQPGLMDSQWRQEPRRHPVRKVKASEKETTRPQGPLIIAISIEKQNLKIYDANGLFAQTPISTGMRGHPTPTGIFSVIQKHKLHHSNIYSGAPMPYMQRITWSGVAIHAGVLPGYPASHGCIRIPIGFAIKMWNWSKIGARVVVTPGEITPANFTHPLLATQKMAPQPITGPQEATPPAAEPDKVSNAGTAIKPMTSRASFELRSTVGHISGVETAKDETIGSMPLRDQTHTADASGDIGINKIPVTMIDASPSGNNVSSVSEDAPFIKTDEASKTDTKTEAIKPETEQTTATLGETASSDITPVENESSEMITATIKHAETPVTGEADKKTDRPAVAAQASGDVAWIETPAAASRKAEKADEKRNETAADTVTAGINIGASTIDVETDHTKKALPNPAEPVASKPDPATSAAASKRTGQIAVFISRKDSRLYVRQNFAPLFDVSVTIAPSDRPLGTHVFTAQIDKHDANIVHWSAISLPTSAKHSESDRFSRRRQNVSATVEAKLLPVPDGPAEALNRLSIPEDTMTRIVEALSTGSSIVVSDQSISAGETGEGTDFIVSLR